MFDLDQSGKISKDELQMVLGSIDNHWYVLEEDAYKDKDDTYWLNMIKDADTNGDGEVNILYILDWLSWIHRNDGQIKDMIYVLNITYI